MSTIALKDILISARQESYRMRHFYLGVEHLFIALLEVKGGLTSALIQERGLKPEYVIDAMRRKVGKGSKHRLWAGIPNTPRADIILGIANDLALEDNRDEINERDLLVAVLEEKDSVAVRVLNALGIKDMEDLIKAAQTHTLQRDSQRPYVKIDFGADFDRTDTLNKDQLFILRRMFYGHSQIRIDRRLTGGYSQAILLVVTPIHGDNREDAAVVVKIDNVDAILDEAQRYESHVRGTLPPLTARLEDKPVAPETSELAGLKYTLIAGYDRTTNDLRAKLQEWAPSKLGDWLHNELYPAFGRIWWQQNRPYRLQVWREYDWVLPPVLTLESIGDKAEPEESHTLKFPIKRSKLKLLEYGDLVTVENFIVQKVDPEQGVIQLAIGHGTDTVNAYKVEVRGIDLDRDTYYRGEVVESITGKVWQTRDVQLTHAVRALEPDFELDADKIPYDDERSFKLPNPLKAYEELLDRQINGTLSTIHGDLHPGNIMIGPNNSAFLIDFAHTRDGHTVFDWATLEIGLLSDGVMAAAGESWDDARTIIKHLMAINAGKPSPDPDSPIANALGFMPQLRDIVQRCLLEPDMWGEYYIALALCALRTMGWDTMPIASRRLMFMVAALSIHQLKEGPDPGGPAMATSPDETDINITY